MVLMEGHGLEGDAHAGAFARYRYLARRQPEGCEELEWDQVI